MYTIHRIDQDGHWQQFGTQPILISAPQWSHMVCDVPMQFYRVGKNPSVKADLGIYSHIVDVSLQCISVSLILGILVLVTIGLVFVNPVTNRNIYTTYIHIV